MKPILTLAGALVLGACGQGQDVNPPTQPAAAIQAPSDEVVSGSRPGTGSRSFVGRWAAEPQWCADPAGAERPIDITLERFEGYENTCSIDEIEEANEAWVLGLTCQAEGETHRRSVRAAAIGDLLTLTWSDAPGSSAIFHRCSTLADTAN